MTEDAGPKYLLEGCRGCPCLAFLRSFELLEGVFVAFRRGFSGPARLLWDG